MSKPFGSTVAQHYLASITWISLPAIVQKRPAVLCDICGYQSKALRPEQLQQLLTVLDTDYKHLITSYRTSWHTAEDRESARQRLASSVSHARQAAQSLELTRDLELRPLVSQLILQSELADGTLKDPSVLQR